MRFSVPATAIGLCLLPLGLALPAPPAAPRPAAPANTQPAPTGMTADTSGPEAAVRHAKRTACRKEARAKKLVGAKKDAYIKDCVAGH